jgi:predicted GIY-YIG superfamily endonuclease
MAIVYRHIRLDKNEVFYIGMGKDIERAYSKKGRNEHWKSIYKITPIKIEILFKNLTLEEALNKEIEFIKIYGRRDLKKGTLVNMTDGGEGTINHSPEVIKSISNKLIGRKIPNESAKKSAIARTGLKRGKSTGDKISKKLKNKPKSEAHKFALSKAKVGKKSNNSTQIIQCNKDGVLLNIYNSQREASRILNISKGVIYNNLNGLTKLAGGFIFTYKK